MQDIPPPLRPRFWPWLDLLDLFLLPLIAVLVCAIYLCFWLAHLGHLPNPVIDTFFCIVLLLLSAQNTVQRLRGFPAFTPRLLKRFREGDRFWSRTNPRITIERWLEHQATLGAARDIPGLHAMRLSVFHVNNSPLCRHYEPILIGRLRFFDDHGDTIGELRIDATPLFQVQSKDLGIQAIARKIRRQERTFYWPPELGLPDLSAHERMKEAEAMFELDRLLSDTVSQIDALAVDPDGTGLS